MPPAPPPPAAPRVVIIGGGFGGLYAARTLARARVQITLLDRRNHHVFQPMLYQVATASLSPAQIAAPIRRILARQANCRVLLSEATAIDVHRKVVTTRQGEVGYDWLIVAAGARHSYFAHPEWEQFAPGLKTIEDAIEIRRRFLLAFERAEEEPDAAKVRERLTSVVVGAGPTGVEMAGAMAEIARRSLPREFRHIDTRDARVILIEAEPRVLASFPEDLSAAALRSLKELGVEVLLGKRVADIQRDRVRLSSGEEIVAGTIVWAAGVHAAPLAQTLGAPLDRAGRVLVQPDLTVPDHPEVFVIGDLASIMQDGRPVPGVSPAAMQMGRFVAHVIRREAAAGPARERPQRFHYVNKGELATIGRARAVGVLGFGLNTHLTGFIAWALWALVHITYLIGFRSRLMVLIDWAWAYLVFERGARLITGDPDAKCPPTHTEV
jgi:NADH:ubiquinone reductase (H+-translocating)